MPEIGDSDIWNQTCVLYQDNDSVREDKLNSRSLIPEFFQSYLLARMEQGDHGLM